jgi:hypothetical protein
MTPKKNLSERLSNGILVTSDIERIMKLVNKEKLTIEDLIYCEILPREWAIRIATGEKFDVKEVIRDICEDQHASCVYCPVFALQTDDERNTRNCPHFRDGTAMLKFLIERGN